MAEKKTNNNKIISIQDFIERKAAQRLDFAITKSQTLLEILLIEITQKKLANQKLSHQLAKLDEIYAQISQISDKSRITKADRVALKALLNNVDLQAIAYINDETEKCLNDEACPAALLKIKLQELAVNISDFMQVYQKNKETIVEQLEKIKEYLPVHLAQARSLLLKAKNDASFPPERYERQKENFAILMQEFDQTMRH